MSGRVEGKVIVITGAAGGQGAAETARLSAEGATVIPTDLAAPDHEHGRELDVASPDAWAALRGWIEECFGRVDGLINNAGTTSRVRLPDVDVDEWNRTLAVNLTGPMLGITTLLPLMGTGPSPLSDPAVAARRQRYGSGHGERTASIGGRSE